MMIFSEQPTRHHKLWIKDPYSQKYHAITMSSNSTSCHQHEGKGEKAEDNERNMTLLSNYQQRARRDFASI